MRIETKFFGIDKNGANCDEIRPILQSIDPLFECRPSLLYPIFVNQWSGTVNDDKLLIGSVNTCVAVRPFSMYGLPYSK